MVEVIDIHFDLVSEETGRLRIGERLRAALLKVPRHLFVPGELMMAAYQDGPLPIGFDKTISQPFIAALMIDLLDLGADGKVLEVGTGLGYQTALLAELSGHVWSVEIVEEFSEFAQLRMAALGYENVSIRTGHGVRGWADAAPFDSILVTAAAAEPPAQLLDQLKPEGRLVMPLGGEDAQDISVIEKGADEAVLIRKIIPARFTRLETD